MLKNTKHKTGVLPSREGELSNSKLAAKESVASNSNQYDPAAVDNSYKATEELNKLRKLSQGQSGGNKEHFDNKSLRLESCDRNQ